MSKFTVAHRFGFIELKKESLVFFMRQGIFHINQHLLSYYSFFR